MNKKFSERIGAVAPSTVIQLDGMNEELKNSLWNIIYITYNDQHRNPYACSWKDIARDTAFAFRKVPVDSIPYDEYDCQEWIKGYYYSLEWYHVYDLVEFIVAHAYRVKKRNIEELCNSILEKELSGYRFISRILAPISNPLEIEAISESIQVTARTGLLGANEHFETALMLFGKRPEPDYRNAIKEAISAVESVAKQLSGLDSSKGLADPLNVLDKKIEMHSALKQGFLKLYGYSSDEDGVRHAIVDEPNVGFDEAKYMIVSCSAFVNFLISKANSCGLLPKEA